MEETKALQEEFAEKVKAFWQERYSSDMELTFEELCEDIVNEIAWQVADWYEGVSYYAKPEDILVDFLQLSPIDAHKFLPLFNAGFIITPNQEEYMAEDVSVIKELFHENCGGKDSCTL